MIPERILVTGSNGFVGRHLLPILLNRFPGASIQQAQFDITDRSAVFSVIRQSPPDACLHLAAISAVPVARQAPDLAWQVNLHGTLNLAEALRAEAPHCWLIFASSADAYGSSFRSGTALTEDAPLAPLNTYGATKAAADLALGAMAAEGLRVIRVRAFNHIGPGQSEDFVVAAFAHQIARIALGRQPPVLQVGDLSPMRDFMDVRDVCAGYAACIDAAERLVPGEVLNFASGTPRRIADVLKDLMQAAGVHADIQTDPTRLRPSDIPIVCGSAAKAWDLLGWQPVVQWAETIAAVTGYWRDRVAAESSHPDL